MNSHDTEQSTVKRKLVFYKTIQHCLYILMGIAGFGMYLDAISNAISVVSPPITYALSAIIFLVLVLHKAVLTRFPINWIFPGSQIVQIKRLGIKPKLALTGVLILIW